MDNSNLTFTSVLPQFPLKLTKPMVPVANIVEGPAVPSTTITSCINLYKTKTVNTDNKVSNLSSDNTIVAAEKDSVSPILHKDSCQDVVPTLLPIPFIKKSSTLSSSSAPKKLQTISPYDSKDHKPVDSSSTLTLAIVPTFSPSQSSLPPSTRIVHNKYMVNTQALDNDPDTYFRYVFSDPAPFKTTIEYMARMTETAYVYCSEEEIRLVMGTPDGVVTNVANIFTTEILESEYANETGIGVYVFELVLNEMKALLKSVGKTSGLTMYNTPGDEHIYFEITASKGAVGGGQTVQVIKPRQIDQLVDYLTPEYKSRPNIKLCTCDHFKEAGDGKHSHVTIKGYEKGMLIMTGLVNENASSTGTFLRDGVIRSPANPLATKMIARAHMKSLNSIKGLSNGLIKIYFEPGLPMRIEKAIGNYGKLNVYINSLPSLIN